MVFFSQNIIFIILCDCFIFHNWEREHQMMFPYSALLHIQSPSTIFNVDFTFLPISPSKLDMLPVRIRFPSSVQQTNHRQMLPIKHYCFTITIVSWKNKNWKNTQNQCATFPMGFEFRTMNIGTQMNFNKNQNSWRIANEKNGLILWMRSENTVFWLCLWQLIQSTMSQPTLMLFFQLTATLNPAHTHAHIVPHTRLHVCEFAHMFVCVCLGMSGEMYVLPFLFKQMFVIYSCKDCYCSNAFSLS